MGQTNASGSSPLSGVVTCNKYFSLAKQIVVKKNSTESKHVVCVVCQALYQHRFWALLTSPMLKITIVISSKERDTGNKH
ncbi:hypothetical protein BpHYR1_046244 [Brachionus plicatilis]|uniref:Uncharacterized protein n=1 Tax=Brachionus plicatilis TaxID=10195 RepID=A0A3M7R9N2_BRAPC|nr:hypothetical protein BpHYR1_046244 [Brachionus plicatilis]